MADPRHHFTMQYRLVIVSRNRLHTFFVQVKKTAQTIKKSFMCCALIIYSWFHPPGHGYLEQLNLPPSQVLKQRGKPTYLFSCPFLPNDKCVVYACKVFFPCVWLFWPVVTSIRGFSGLSRLQTVSSAKVQAGTVFSCNTDCPISRQDLPLCTVAPWLTLPLTILRVRIKLLLSPPDFFIFSKFDFLLKLAVISKTGSQG